MENHGLREPRCRSMISNGSLIIIPHATTRSYAVVCPRFRVHAFASSSHQRTCTLVHLDAREIHVARWNAADECMQWSPDDAQELAERYRSTVYDLDRHLGPYPDDAESKARAFPRWLALTDRISVALVKRIMPTGTITSMTGSNLEPAYAGRLTAAEPPLPPSAHVDVDELQFTSMDLRRSFGDTIVGAKRSRLSQDKSWLLRSVLQGTGTMTTSARDLLGELQLSFILLLIAQNFEGFEQWKRLVHLITLSDSFLAEPVTDKEAMFTADFLNVLQRQLEQVPVDFFQDVLSSENFLRHCLKNVYRVLVVHAYGETLNGTSPLVDITRPRLLAKQLAEFLASRFDWDLAAEVLEEERALDEEEAEEDKPVVVEL